MNWSESGSRVILLKLFPVLSGDCLYLHMQRIPLFRDLYSADSSINHPPILLPCNRRPWPDREHACRCESSCWKNASWNESSVHSLSCFFKCFSLILCSCSFAGYTSLNYSHLLTKSLFIIELTGMPVVASCVAIKTDLFKNIIHKRQIFIYCESILTFSLMAAWFSEMWEHYTLVLWKKHLKNLHLKYQ